MYNNLSITVSKNDKKHNKSKNTVQKPIKKRTYKLAKAEKNRFSIIYRDLDKCGICGAKRTDLHEVFGGAYRQASIKHGMVMPLCHEHHERMHRDYKYALNYKIAFEERFLVNHSLEEFIEIFKIDYRVK